MTFASALVGISLLVGISAKADDSLLPPRAQALRPKVIARDAQNDPDLVRRQPMGLEAKAAALKPPMRVKTSPNEPNLISRPLYTGKTFRDTREPQFEVAPIK